LYILYRIDKYIFIFYVHTQTLESYRCRSNDSDSLFVGHFDDLSSQSLWDTFSYDRYCANLYLKKNKQKNKYKSDHIGL